MLDLVTEDSYGLWEILTAISGPSGQENLSTDIDVARVILMRMIDRGWLEVEQIDQGRIEKIGDERQLDAVLANVAHWKPPVRGDVEVRVVATDAGDEAYLDLSSTEA